MKSRRDIYSAAGLMAYIQEVGFLPLLSSGVYGFSAEEAVADDCRYVVSSAKKIRQLQEIYTKQIANCDELKQSLLQKAFEGEL